MKKTTYKDIEQHLANREEFSGNGMSAKWKVADRPLSLHYCGNVEPGDRYYIVRSGVVVIAYYNEKEDMVRVYRADDGDRRMARHVNLCKEWLAPAGQE